MSDIVERLKKTQPREVCEHGSQRVKCPICELAEAEAEIERLRAALREIDENFNVLQPQTQGSVLHRISEIARAALERKYG